MLQSLNLNIEEMNKNNGSVKYQIKDGVIYGITNPEHELWKSIKEDKPMVVFACKEVEPGIYESGLNFEHRISMYSNFETYGDYQPLSKEGVPIESMDFKELIAGQSAYGIADSIEQIKEHFKEMIASENPLVISVTEMRKDEQPEDGGWRWHKWGQYIGKQDPQTEYLYDEPKIESVYVYHIYAVRPKLEKTIESTMDSKTESKRLKM